ncbi:hypothetical protein J2Z21_009302 [Streptomyces griseochromogenes]|uniref:Carrier domain-containing protein n=1 Tax=Streptomyces griseochromogenes TaxID=68214 RepID=A0ABS4MA69_9ACTN|nr:phosphopantetheine-binding protein [Streptomyces griseochromogenes]MBP2056284.1 hypothetical protein [Streptomyces griseochromogenes]
MADSLRALLPDSIPPHRSLHRQNARYVAWKIAMVNSSGPATDDPTPQTDTERMLAELWAEVLGLSASSIGRNDDFFSAAGSSPTVIRLAVKLEKQISLRDIVNNSTPSNLGAILDKGMPHDNATGVRGRVIIFRDRVE